MLKSVDEALRHYYKTHWANLPGLLLQDPQPIADCYVHLALVDQLKQRQKEQALAEGGLDEGQQSATGHSADAPNLALRDARLHSYEDIYRPTKPIDVDAIFTPDRDSSRQAIHRLLIVGRAGVGKSTLCQHLAYRWATEGLFKERFETIFWLRLKHLNQAHFLNQKSLTLADVIRMDWQSHQAAQPVPTLRDIQASLAKENTLLILDGFDEVAHLSDKPNPIGGVLQAALQYKNVLLTTRPYGVPHAIRFDRTLENLGFSDDQIAQYIAKQAGQAQSQDSTATDETAKVFCKQLRQNPNVWGIAHIPLNLNLLCQLRFDETAEVDFSQEMSLTRLYSEMGKRLLQHYVKEKKTATKQSTRYGTSLSAQELEDRCRPELRLLERLAFEGLVSGKLLIPAQKVRMVKQEVARIIGPSSVDDLLALALETGFLKGVGESARDVNRSYYFIHLTFQEYLAAHYLVRGLNARDRGGAYFQRVLGFIEREKYRPEYRIVFRFAAGLLSLDATDPMIEEADAPYSEALCYFWDAIVCSPQDLIGLQRIDLWMSCLDEVKRPGTDTFDNRIKHQALLFKELEAWLTKCITAYKKNGIVETSWQRFLMHRGLWQRLGLLAKVKQGLRNKNKYVREAALKVLAALCEVAPDAVFADKGLVAAIKAGLRDEGATFARPLEQRLQPCARWPQTRSSRTKA